MAKQTNIGYHSLIPQNLEARLEALEAGAGGGGKTQLIIPVFDMTVDAEAQSTSVTIGNAGAIMDFLDVLADDPTKCVDYDVFAQFMYPNNEYYVYCYPFASNSASGVNSSPWLSLQDTIVSALYIYIDNTGYSELDGTFGSDYGPIHFSMEELSRSSITEDDTFEITNP